jgi:hypothetical protein
METRKISVLIKNYPSEVDPRKMKANKSIKRKVLNVISESESKMDQKTRHVDEIE